MTQGISPPTKQIPVSRGRWHTLVDDDVYVWASRFKWTGAPCNHGVYVFRSLKRAGAKRTYSLHRLIMGDPAGQEVHHINGDPLDNRLANLEVLSRTDHRRLRPAGRSGVRGVNQRSRYGRTFYEVRHGISHERVHVGTFYTLEQAVAALEAFAQTVSAQGAPK